MSKWIKSEQNNLIDFDHEVEVFEKYTPKISKIYSEIKNLEQDVIKLAKEKYSKGYDYYGKDFLLQNNIQEYIKELEEHDWIEDLYTILTQIRRELRNMKKELK